MSFYNTILSQYDTTAAICLDSFTGGSPFYDAAPGYATQCFLADNWLVYDNVPASFTPQQIVTLIQKFSILDNNSRCPFLCQRDGTPSYQSCTSAFLVILLGQLVYQRSGDLSWFTSLAPTWKIAMQAVIANNMGGTHHLITNPGQSWAFQDGVVKTGECLFESVLWYNACIALTQLYTAAGDMTNANLFNNYAINTLTGISSLYNIASGMFFTDSLVNLVPDINGSAYAAFSGMTTPSQTAAVKNYLINNYNALTNQYGFIRQTIPSFPGQGGNWLAGSYDNGGWSYGHKWIGWLLGINNLINLLTSYVAGGTHMAIEWYNYPDVTITGNTNNIASIVGVLFAANALQLIQEGNISVGTPNTSSLTIGTPNTEPLQIGTPNTSSLTIGTPNFSHTN
jgi:hypothetical protein